MDEGVGKFSARAGVHEVKRRERRAPGMNFGNGFPGQALVAHPARAANPGLRDLNSVGVRGRSATFRSLQCANGRESERISTRAGSCELKGRERRAP